LALGADFVGISWLYIATVLKNDAFVTELSVSASKLIQQQFRGSLKNARSSSNRRSAAVGCTQCYHRQSWLTWKDD
jgi:hypothetical protein